MINLGELSEEINRLAAEIQRQIIERAKSAGLSRETLSEVGDEWRQLNDKIYSSKTSWLPAEILERSDCVYPLPIVPFDHTVVAVDGSQIAPERHGIADYFLIQTGGIILKYGLSSSAKRFRDAELFVGGDLNLDEGRPETIVARTRTNKEFEQLQRALELNISSAGPTVGMCDGTLVLWMLDESEQRDGVASLTGLLDFGFENRCPVVGYISSPGSREVVTALRLQRCPFDQALCQKNCSQYKDSLKRSAPCGGMEGATDAHLFAAMLKVGERSAIFGSRSKVVLNCYSERNKIKFFYLRTDREVVRVELPAWVGNDPELLNWVHSICFDQANKGGGYPVALSEAHECAVVTAEDRRNLNRVLEKKLAALKVPLTMTRKALSKRIPRV